MYRMIPSRVPLPTCRNGHAARHILDARKGGSHLVECACSQTGRHADFDAALAEWRRTQGHVLVFATNVPAIAYFPKRQRL